MMCAVYNIIHEVGGKNRWLLAHFDRDGKCHKCSKEKDCILKLQFLEGCCKQHFNDKFNSFTPMPLIVAHEEPGFLCHL